MTGGVEPDIETPLWNNSMNQWHTATDKHKTVWNRDDCMDNKPTVKKNMTNSIIS